MVRIVVYKEKAVNLAICSISEEDAVSLQLIDNTPKIDLQVKNHIKRFSSLLISTIRELKYERTSIQHKSKWVL